MVGREEGWRRVGEVEEVMEEDLKLMSKLVLPVTRKHIHDLSRECAKELIREFAKEELMQYLKRGVTFPQLS